MPTVFDHLYQSLFNKSCKKEGEAFERIVAAVTGILFPEADISHDQKIRGLFSESLYQIDVLIDESGKQSFGEAKDYTSRGEGGGKVGRSDLQKLGGALPDVGVERGVFFSATGYTREAKKYAAAAKRIVGAPIDLMHIRPTVESDLEGRIKKIVLRVHARIPDYATAKWTPVFTAKGQKKLEMMLEDNGQNSMAISLKLENFVDATGAPKTSIEELTAAGFGGDYEKASGCWHLPEHHVEVNGQLIEIHGIEYEVCFVGETDIIEIIVEGEPKILVKAEDGSVHKVITDVQLRAMEFDENGRLVR